MPKHNAGYGNEANFKVVVDIKEENGNKAEVGVGSTA